MVYPLIIILLFIRQFFSLAGMMFEWLYRGCYRIDWRITRVMNNVDPKGGW